MQTPLTRIFDAKTARPLADVGLKTLGDLVGHYPRRYAERAGLTDLATVRLGEQVTVLAEVRRVTLRRMRHRRGTLLEVRIGDGRGSLVLTFFNQPWHERRLRVGRRGLFAGKVTAFQGVRQLNSPDYVLLDEGDAGAVEDFAGGLIPVYPATAGCRSWTIARAVQVGLAALDTPEDPLPAAVRDKYRLVDLATALRDVHRPGSPQALHAARERLKWDEALVLQIALAQLRRAAGADAATPRPVRPGGLLAAFDARLPFALTSGQAEVGEVIRAELGRPHPMRRLLQGEVGAGKTVVALRAMLQTVDAGGQAALLAPTEVLAAQHLRSIRELLGPLGRAGELDGAAEATRVTLLTGSQAGAARRAALAEVSSGEAGIVVGTHALLEAQVRFADLGLVVIDEQHRFGVEQRDALRAKGARPPHVLVMTATPIPRTVAMTVYGDLETSSLRELPPGRTPISSSVVPTIERPAWLDRAWQRVREEVAAGHRAYVVCPRIGEAAAVGEDVDEHADETLDVSYYGGRGPAAAVLTVLPMLAEGPLSGLRVAALHGRLPPEEKERVMRHFAAGMIDVLVATTVVEVGVDVHDATVMVVLDADRFGVSQLHQLRGRVGRGQAQGLCLLVTDAEPDSASRRRLEAVAATVDGFQLARLDLEQRREGDVLGAAQSGRRSQLKLLSLLHDEELIVAARAEADALLGTDPTLAEHPALSAAVTGLLDEENAEYLEKA